MKPKDKMDRTLTGFAFSSPEEVLDTVYLFSVKDCPLYLLSSLLLIVSLVLQP